jgi:hypothetical protein
MSCKVGILQRREGETGEQRPQTSVNEQEVDGRWTAQTSNQHIIAVTSTIQLLKTSWKEMFPTLGLPDPMSDIHSNSTPVPDISQRTHQFAACDDYPTPLSASLAENMVAVVDSIANFTRSTLRVILRTTCEPADMCSDVT